MFAPSYLSNLMLATHLSKNIMPGGRHGNRMKMRPAGQGPEQRQDFPSNGFGTAFDPAEGMILTGSQSTARARSDTALQAGTLLLCMS